MIKSVPYVNGYIRVLAAFGATLIVLFQGRPIDLQKALHSGLFWIAFFVSFTVALLLVYIIHRVVVRLDRTHPWNVDSIERSIHQIIQGFAAPLLIEFMAFAGYHLINGENIFLNRFFPQDFFYTSWLLLLLNLYYYLHARFYYWHQEIKIKNNPALTQEPAPPQKKRLQVARQPEIAEEEVLVIKYKRTQVHLLPEDIYCMYRSGKNVRILTADKNIYTTPESISSLESRFSNKGLLRINREVILNLSVMLGYQPGIGRHMLKIFIKHKYSTIQHTLTYDQLMVTKDHIAPVKAALPELSRNGQDWESKR